MVSLTSEEIIHFILKINAMKIKGRVFIYEDRLKQSFE